MLIIICVLFIVGYFKVCYAIDKEKFNKILYVFLMTFLFSLSILVNFIFLHKNDELTKKVENKCPEYEQITVYKLKKNE